jgi:SAM-dependent methyltransferase
MLQRARKRISRFPGAELVESSIASLRIPGKQWDAAVMMFAVLSYHTSEEEILGALRAAREHLRPGALFVADVWYGPAVLASPPSARTTSIGDESEGWIRHVDSDHDPARQLVAVQYRLERLEDGKPHAESRERHVMRYLFPREIAILLELSGFRLVHLGDWPALDAPPGSSGYAACVVARAS